MENRSCSRNDMQAKMTMHRPNDMVASNIKSLNELVTLLKSGDCKKLKGQIKCKHATDNSIIPTAIIKILDSFFTFMIMIF